ncbi:hypothetical protein O2K51_09820 [Apibacter raozihei]|uniref:hypothetical protein n=1 Tax=Apibacter raozihei TaxID=2500547 RepID=UPI000FE309C8|nr:hypothetical protein [Apibacter raozihei]
MIKNYVYIKLMACFIFSLFLLGCYSDDRIIVQVEEKEPSQFKVDFINFDNQGVVKFNIVFEGALNLVFNYRDVQERIFYDEKLVHTENIECVFDEEKNKGRSFFIIQKKSGEWKIINDEMECTKDPLLLDFLEYSEVKIALSVGDKKVIPVKIYYRSFSFECEKNFRNKDYTKKYLPKIFRIIYFYNKEGSKMLFYTNWYTIR